MIEGGVYEGGVIEGVYRDQGVRSDCESVVGVGQGLGDSDAKIRYLCAYTRSHTHIQALSHAHLKHKSAHTHKHINAHMHIHTRMHTHARPQLTLRMYLLMVT